MSLAVMPHAGSWLDADLVAAAERYRHPMVHRSGTGDVDVHPTQVEGSVQGTGVAMASLRRRGDWLELRLVAETPTDTMALVGTTGAPVTAARTCDVLGHRAPRAEAWMMETMSAIDVSSLPDRLSAPDNDSYMLRGDAPHPACSRCGILTDREWIDPSFTLVRHGLDASYTYDGYLVVSERVKSVLKESGARFIKLPSVPGFYVLVVDTVVPFDAARRKTTFERPCAKCGRPFAVAGATPVFLKTTAISSEGLFRTDVEFGTGDEQHPLIIVGSGLARGLRKARLKGVELRPVEPMSL